MNTQEKIDILFENFKEFLKEKNRRYGDSAISPIRIFSKADNIEQLLVRCDDKANRIKNSTDFRKNDIADLFGYISLIMIAKDWLTFDDLLD
jgi:hypothetical protein